MARVLVTGASGFIGRPLVTALKQLGYDVVATSRTDGDVRDSCFWEKQPDCSHVVHLAGLSFVPDSWLDPASYVSVNAAGTMQAVRYCHARGRAHLLYVSAYLYGIPVRLPVREDAPVCPNNPYALSKHMAEQACQFGAEHLQLPVTVMRPFNVFGPGQDERFLIPGIVAQIRRGQGIRVMDLAPRRDYVYVDDMVDALCRGLQHPGGFRVFNIGSGVSYSVHEIIEIAQQVAGSRLSVICDGRRREQEIADVLADISRARELLDWKPRHTLAEGLVKLLADERAT